MVKLPEPSTAVVSIKIFPSSSASAKNSIIAFGVAVPTTDKPMNEVIIGVDIPELAPSVR